MGDCRPGGRERHPAAFLRGRRPPQPRQGDPDCSSAALLSDARHLGSGDRHAIELEIAAEHIENDLPGGDFSEHFHRGPDEVVLYVADASGHADLVSCFMACLASMVLHRSHHHDAHPGAPPDVDQMIRQVDGALHHLRVDGALGHERFVTLFLAVVDLARGELVYVNAGHPEAFLVRGGKVLPLASNSRPAGFLFDAPPEIGRLELRAGDLLFVYTDGACEMLEDGSGARSGIDHLASVVTAAAEESSEEVVRRVAAYLREHAGEQGFEDDTTLLAAGIHAPTQGE